MIALGCIVALYFGLVAWAALQPPEPAYRLIVETPEHCRLYALREDGRIIVCPTEWTVRP